MKSHAKKLLTRMAEHHVTKSQHHTAMSEHFAKLAKMHKAKSDMEDTADVYGAMAQAHTDMATEHQEMGEECVSCCKALMESRKAAMGVDDDLFAMRPLPEGLSVIHGDMPVNKLVLRPGMREPERPNVPREFEKLVSVEDEE
jgi:hypothetical protein